MLTFTRFVFTIWLAILTVHAVKADDGKYRRYEEILREKNDTVKCKLLMSYGIIVNDTLHDYEFALLICQKINSILQQKDYPLIRIRLYFNWASTHYLKGNYEEADTLYRKALSYKYLETRPELKAIILNMAGANAQHMMISKRALNYYNEALEIYTRLNDPKSKGNIYMNMGNLYSASGDFKQAEELMDKAAKIFLQYQMIEDYSLLLANKAEIKSKLGKPDTAKILMIRAFKLPMNAHFKNHGAFINMYVSLATYYSEMKNWDSCFYFLNLGKHTADSMKLSDKFDGILYHAMGHFYNAKNDTKQATYYYKLALKTKNGITDYYSLYETIADIYYKNKQYDSAFYYKNEVIRLTDSIYKSELKEQITFENKKLELMEQDYQSQIHEAEQEHFLQQLKINNYILLGIILLLAVGAFLSFLYFRQYKLKRKKENLQSELDFLKAQLNPHFLFNSINNIYVLLDENKAKASDILLKFSELMRYQLYECNVNTILLRKEIQFLENYIEFEKLRYSNKMEVRYKATDDGEAFGLMIAPLLLQPFIENAFKHTPKKKSQQSLIDISISVVNDQLLFEVSNTLSHEKASALPGGIGLENVKKRLKLLYPNKYDLNITKTDQLFKITLKITLTHD